MITLIIIIIIIIIISLFRCGMFPVGLHCTISVVTVGG